MVCPMGKKPGAVEVGSEYPYQAIYRPWSWIFSSFFNIFLLAILLGIGYYLYRTRKSRKARFSVTYRTVQMQKLQDNQGDPRPVALVTGGNGRLGSELVKALVSEGKYIVHSLDILLPEEANRHEGVHTYIQADIGNFDDLHIAFNGVGVVFHTAGLTPISVRHAPDDFRRVNVGGTENVIRACSERGVKRLVYTSTTSVTVSRDPKVTSVDSDESAPLPAQPLNVYVGTKGQADQLVRVANGKDGLLSCVVRPGAFLESMVSAIADMPVCPTGGGEDGGHFRFSVASVDSVVRAHLLAEKALAAETQGMGDMPPAAAGKAYNIVDANITIPELVHFVASVKNISVISVPFFLVRLLAFLNVAVYRLTGFVPISESLSPMNVGHKVHTYVTTLARKELGWVPGQPWKDVVREVVKAKEEVEGGSKKDN